MRFLTLPALALAFALPATAYAAGTGSDSTTPPSTTKTTQSCEGVQVWDEKTFLNCHRLSLHMSRGIPIVTRRMSG